MATSRVQDVMGDALAIINERGWSQGELEGCDKTVCALGAVHVALTGNPYEEGECKTYVDVIHELASAVDGGRVQDIDSAMDHESFDFIESLCEVITKWNDNRLRKKVDIVSLFAKMAS